MVNGPPCGICGFTLRWLPQQSSWGCDRCQRMFPPSGAGAPQQHQAPQQPSPWAPPNAQQPAQSPQGFSPPQQQGFGASPSRPPQQQGFVPPQQQGFQPPQQQGFAPPQQQGFQPGGMHPGASHPPVANPYAPAGHAAPSHPPGANPYAPPGAQHPGAQHPGAYGQQPAAYSPHPATPAPTGAAPVAGKKSSKGLMIGLGVAGVAIAGGVIAFVLMRGGGGTAGGGSRSDVVKSTLAALGDGDVDQLMKLSDVEGLHEKVVDCSGKTKALKEEGEEDDKELSEKDKEDRDPKKQVEKRKKEFEEVAPRTKGTKIELVEIVTKEPPAPKDDEKKSDDEDDPLGGVMKTGQKLMKGCVAKVPMRIHTAKVKLKVTPKGEEATEQDAEIVLLQIGSGFYLAAAPTVSLGVGALEREFKGIKDKVCACKDAECAQKLKDEFKASPRRKQVKKEIKALSEKDQAKLEMIEDEIKACEKKLGGDDQLEAMEQFRDKICGCPDKTCADKVTQEMTVWGNSNKDAKLSEEDMKKASEIGEEMGKCITRIYSADTGGGAGGGIGATIASAGGLAEASADLPQQCRDYRETILKAANCPKLPQQSRQALLDGWKSMADAWKSFDFKTMPAESVKAIEDACKQGTEAIEQMQTSLGC
ncbi:MAG: hypothetical protein H0T65_09105 [Deltaproteobacteria bacterium]|nr:hypothetical protein [Deltaproteobacteria bacterium]